MTGILDVPPRPRLFHEHPAQSEFTINPASQIARAIDALYEASLRDGGDRRDLIERAAMAMPIVVTALNELFYLRYLEERLLAEEGNRQGAKGAESPSDPSVSPCLCGDLAPELTEHGELLIRCLESEAALDDATRRLEAIAAAIQWHDPASDSNAHYALLTLIGYAAAESAEDDEASSLEPTASGSPGEST